MFDVDSAAPGFNYILLFDGTKYTPVNHVLQALTDVSINNLTLADNDVLTYNSLSSTWVNTSVNSFPFLKLDGTCLMNGTINMNNYKIINVSNPTVSTDVATKGYVDSQVSGMNFHKACEYGSTVNLDCTYNNGVSGVGATLTANNNGVLIIDGITADLVDDRVLIKNQTTKIQNGIYTITNIGSVSTPFVLTRATDYDNSVPGTVSYGDITMLIQGVTQHGAQFVQIGGDGFNIIIGVDDIEFIEFSS